MMVAGRVLTAADHHLIVFHLLRLVGDDIAFALLGHHMPYITLLRADIIRDLIRLVGVLAVFKDRSAFPFVIQTVVHALRVYLTRVQIHTDVLGLQLHLLEF